MIRNLILVYAFFFVAISATAQGVFVNYDIPTADDELKKPLQLWLDFLASGDDQLGSIYWNEAEVKLYGDDAYFLIEHELNFGSDNYLALLEFATIRVLSIQKMVGLYKITNEFAFPNIDGKANVQYIFHVYAKKIQDEFKLFNAEGINQQLYLHTETIDFIRFNFLKTHEFDRTLAEKQVAFLHQIASKFDVPVVPVNYYFAPTKKEINALRGFDFIIGQSGEEIPSGKAYPMHGNVYSSGLGEYYPHEFMHILLSPHYPDCHLWIDEGVATYYGMSRGKTLDWHLNRLADYLEKHPELDLNNMLSLRTMDAYTDFRYVLGGWLVKKTLEKGDIQLLKSLMQSGTSDEELYAAIETHLGIARNNLNNAIRSDLLK